MWSWYLKRAYPIESNHSVENIQKLVAQRKQKYSEIEKKYQLYFIDDPIYKDETLIIIIQNEIQKNTKVLFDHFSDPYYFPFLLENKIDELKTKTLYKILISFSFFILFSYGTVMTFHFLDTQGLNFIPIVMIFIVAAEIIMCCLSSIRYRFLSEFALNTDSHSDLKQIDKKFLELLIKKYYFDEFQQNYRSNNLIN